MLAVSLTCTLTLSLQKYEHFRQMFPDSKAWKNYLTDPKAFELSLLFSILSAAQSCTQQNQNLQYFRDGLRRSLQDMGRNLSALPWRVSGTCNTDQRGGRQGLRFLGQIPEAEPPVTAVTPDKYEPSCRGKHYLSLGELENQSASFPFHRKSIWE